MVKVTYVRAVKKAAAALLCVARARTKCPATSSCRGLTRPGRLPGQLADQSGIRTGWFKAGRERFWARQVSGSVGGQPFGQRRLGHA